VVNVSKDDLLDDFKDKMDVVKSGLYKTAYTAEYGTHGGEPYGAIIANYDFGPGAQDMKLLGYVASVATMAHAPFIAAANEEFFKIDSFSELAGLKDIKSTLERHAKWQGFRESEDSRYVGLTLPRFLLRLPYSPDTVPAKSFTFKEEVGPGDDDFCWGNTAFTFASRMTASFASYRLCANIIGPRGGGTVEDMPVYEYEAMGAVQTKIPTQVEVSDRMEFILAEEGFMALTMRKGKDNATFFSANSVQRPKTFGNTKEGKEAETNFKLGTQFPYMMVVNRLAHYLKVIQRENLGSWKGRGELEDELNKWISQYISDMGNPSQSVRSRRPLRKAQIDVTDVEGDPGWYRVSMKVVPHFKFMGASFTLSLVGKLDKQ
jgi:type VI secretion system protein ImpC